MMAAMKRVGPAAAVMAALLAAVLLAPDAARAGLVVQWTITGGAFSDGGTPSGSFDYDADAMIVSDGSPSVAGGTTPALPPFT
jgi:hypothetical protein